MVLKHIALGLILSVAHRAGYSNSVRWGMGRAIHDAERLRAGRASRPDNPKVRLRTAPPACVAVIQFSGLARPDDVAAKTVELIAWIKSHHLHAKGPASLAQYNPPWTLWFMRRNEVMIPIDFDG